MSSTSAVGLPRSSGRTGALAALAGVVGLCGALALALVVALKPGWAAVAAAAILALAFVLAVVFEERGAVAALLPAVALAGLAAAALWPTLAVVLAALVLLVVAIKRAPVHAFAVALLLTGLEGSIKLRLTLEGAPSARALGAGLIDIAFGAALVGLVAHDRGRTARRVWGHAGRLERAAIMLLLGWLAISLLQVTQTGSVVDGIEGFRLLQAYSLAAIAGMILFRLSVPERRVTTLLLAVMGAISAYAALRTVIGPSGEESFFSLERTRHAALGETKRNIGSFSGPFGLASFLVPAAVFGLVLGYLRKRDRVLAWTIAALAAIGVVGSYVRTALVAIAAGAVFLAGVLIGGRRVPRRVRTLAVALIFVVAGAGYAGAVSVGEVSEFAEERAAGLRDPLRDESLDTRLETWKRTIDRIADKPLGTGIGTVGHATFTGGQDREVFTDNSYLKVLLEQGIVVGLMFVAGLLALCGALVRRFVHDGPMKHPIGIAALAGFIAFLVLAVMAEYFEQPGKVLAWTLLGIAICDAFLGVDADSIPERRGRRAAPS